VRFLKQLYVQVLLAIVLGIAVGYWGVELGALVGLPDGAVRESRERVTAALAQA